MALNNKERADVQKKKKTMPGCWDQEEEVDIQRECEGKRDIWNYI